ncbi:MAG: MCP four helix bundle domain-containing protein, partial [Gammaproteobacteria bacterium]|nr:MCP four helix bundle domain-containing protein [Gammaproteobacteria bacterium]
MNQLKISTRLTLAFAVMVALLITLGAVSLIMSATQRTELKDVVEVRIPITKALGALADRVNVQAIQFRNLALFTTDTETRSALDQIAATRTTSAEQYKTLVSLIVSAEGKEVLARMQQRRAELMKVADQYLAMIRQGQREEATKLLEEQLRHVQLAYQTAIQDQIELQSQIAKSAGERAESAAAALQRGVLIAGVLAIGLAIFLAITIIRSITRPLAQAAEAADRVAGG